MTKLIPVMINLQDPENWKKLQEILKVNPKTTLIVNQKKLKLLIFNDELKLPIDMFKSDKEIITDLNIKTYLSIKKTKQYWTVKFNKQKVATEELEAIAMAAES
jgi:hypothetical protein